MPRKIISLVVLTTVLTACTGTDLAEELPTSAPIETSSTSYPIDTDAEEPVSGYPVERETQAPATAYPVETQALDLRTTADLVIMALAEKDLAEVAEFVHPQRGLRFSPYAFVREEHQVFMPEELPRLVGSDEIFTWGAYDGTGEPINLTFDEYFQEFVYSSDFANPEQTAVNERIGQGNSINNIGEFFPEASFVEYHFSGFEEDYGGMDWESLRLLFVEVDRAWRLVGIVHDEWTI